MKHRIAIALVMMVVGLCICGVESDYKELVAAMESYSYNAKLMDVLNASIVLNQILKFSMYTAECILVYILVCNND